MMIQLSEGIVKHLFRTPLRLIASRLSKTTNYKVALSDNDVLTRAEIFRTFSLWDNNSDAARRRFNTALVSITRLGQD